MKKLFTLMVMAFMAVCVNAQDTWTVAGTAPLVDKTWDPSDAAADMTSEDGVIFIYVKENITLEQGITYKFKVAKNHSWNEAYPGSDYELTVDETALYKVTITFNAETKDVNATAEKTGEAGAMTHTYSVIGTIVGNWDIDTEMTKGDDGLYKAVFEDVAKGEYKFKVRVDKDWSISYPGQDYALTVEQDGSTVTVTFNEDTKEVIATVSTATGITTKTVNLHSAQRFNLAGQKVDASYKGVVIENGKKFLVK